MSNTFLNTSNDTCDIKFRFLKDGSTIATLHAPWKLMTGALEEHLKAAQLNPNDFELKLRLEETGELTKPLSIAKFFESEEMLSLARTKMSVFLKSKSHSKSYIGTCTFYLNVFI